MAKVRIYQLARETGVAADDILAAVRSMGVEVKSNLSGIDPDVAERFKATLKDGGAAPEAKAPAKKAAASKKKPTTKTAATRKPAPKAKTAKATPAKAAKKPSMLCAAWAWKNASAIIRANCPAGSSKGWPLPVHW